MTCASCGCVPDEMQGLSSLDSIDQLNERVKEQSNAQVNSHEVLDFVSACVAFWSHRDAVE